MKVASLWIRMTLIAVVVYLIVTNGTKSARVIQAGGAAYADSVRALTGQGSGNSTRKR